MLDVFGAKVSLQSTIMAINELEELVLVVQYVDIATHFLLT